MENIIESPLNPRDKQFSDQLDPDNPSWQWYVSFGFWLVSIFLIAFFQSIFIPIYLSVRDVNTNGVSFAEALKNLQTLDFASVLKTDPGVMFWTVASVLVAHIFTLILAWMIITRIGKDSFKEAVGWSQKRFSVWNSLIAVGLFYILAVVLGMIFGEQEDEFSRMLKSSREIVYAIAIIATFSAPIVEEVIYRGLIFSSFYKRFGSVTAVLITTFMFAGVHYLQYWGNWTAVIAITTLSFVITMIRYRSKSLLPCIVLHTIFNASQSVILLLQPWLESMATDEKAAFFHLFK
jgi:uncharacterized protein